MKLWGARFSRNKLDPHFEKFSESFSVDRRLVGYDLRVNGEYVKALGRAGVLGPGEVERLVRGLKTLERYVANNSRWAERETSEDVHTWAETRLEREVGAVARKLRTGRSRNDLVATETRLFVKDAVGELERAVLEFLDALVSQARRHPRVVMPGYTHLQPAQPILFAHYLLAYFEMLKRDWQRLEQCRARADELPLGSGALAGSSFPIDRARLARALGFARIAQNSVDATSDRDFVCELLFACSLVLAHLSRLAEDLIIFSSPGFGYVELSEDFSTGSSLMPQKKNPDALELVRGKAARVLGRLTSVLALLKGLPLAYNRDLQEDKVALFDAVDTTRDALVVAARLVKTLRIDEERMKAAAEEGYLTATDLADELVRRGTPFAQAHEQVGKLVRHCIAHRKSFRELSETEARGYVPAWDEKLQAIAASPELAARRKNVVGGTAPSQVTWQIRLARAAVERLRRRTASGV